MSRGVNGSARVRATIEGRVQGVGFRPAIYRHAVACGLKGFVRNDAGGVTLEVEGRPDDLRLFFDRLEESLPPLAVVARVATEDLPPEGYEAFAVVASESGGVINAQLPPDLATCPTCFREMSDPEDRRYRYPFTNCVDCGPRFTIIRDLPYDRPNTSMAGFRLCPDCEREYRDPSDRRFHAEPNACPRCGPQLRLLDVEGRLLAGGEAALGEAQELIADRAVVAVKGLGGYHLACDAFCPEAILRLRERKRRPHKTLAVMLRDMATVERYFTVTPEEAAELASPPRPIVVLDGRLDAAISPDTGDTGVFLPYTPLHHLLLERFEALVMTSGNRLEEPIAQDEEQIVSLMRDGIADAALAHDRPVQHRCDDSVVRFVDGQRRFLRRARGFVPNPLRIAGDSPVVLATGADVKNSFCLTVRGNAYVSQHIGDLADLAAYAFFEDEIDRWLELLHTTADVVAHDLHPAYLSTRYASRLDGVTLVGVQHHHAHIAAAMAEHGLEGPVLGVTLDGTGYGPDGTVWGGEFLLAGRDGFERLGHFKQYPLPAGERAIDEPWRMAVSICSVEGIDAARALGRTPAAGSGVPGGAVLDAGAAAHAAGRAPIAGAGGADAVGPRGWLTDGRADKIRQLMAAGLNCPLTSSAGRLFDAAAALLGLCDIAGYEAQAAIRLEMAVAHGVRDAYPFTVDGRGPLAVLDLGPAFDALVGDAGRGVGCGVIAARFHNGVVAATATLVRRLCAERGLSDVVLSGGVFQNRIILSGLTAALQASGLAVHTNVWVPCNDGGISLGQAAVALARMRGERACA